MTGYSRNLVSLEIALKEIIKDLKDEGLKKATGKSESYFRKCSDENDTGHNIHHKDSVAIDIECLKRKLGNPMLTAHEDLLEATSDEYKNLNNTSTTLINIGAKIGRLMEATQSAINPESEGGHKISQSEKQKIEKAIKDVEDKILELKLIIERAAKLSEIK